MRTTRDILFALRQIRSRPAFAAAVVLTLALGIGANAAVFSVVDAVVLRSLPYPEADRLVRLWSAYPEGSTRRGTVSPPDLRDWRAASRTLEAVAGWPALHISGLVLTEGDAPVELATTFVTEGFFATLGLEAARGRTLSEADHVEGRNRVVVLSHGAWLRHFGGRPEVVGGTVRLGGEPFTVLGVMPPEMEFPEPRTEAWAPLSLIPETGVPRHRAIRWLQVVGRLAPGASAAAARSELASIAGGLAEDHPETNEGLTAVTVGSLREEIVGPVRPAMLAVFGAVGLVLLIGCANVASLALARSEERGRELVVRAALGAGRGDIVRQLLAESLALATLGGVAGLLLGVWGVRALVAMAPADIPRLAAVGVDLRLLGFTAAISILTGLLFGLAPALRASRPDLQSALREGGRGGTGVGRRGGRLRSVLVVGQVALVAVLAVGAGLLMRSYRSLLDVDPGFRPAGLLTLRVAARGDDYVRVLHESLERIREIPGVEEAGMVRPLPLRYDAFQGEGALEVEIPGRESPPDARQPEVYMRFASPGAFRAMGVPLLAGRGFTERDDAEAPPVVVLSRRAAEAYWPDGDPVRSRIRVSGIEVEVVGVVGDVRMTALSEDPVPAVYVAHRQVSRRGMTLLVRSRDPGSVLAPVQRAIWEIAPDQPIEDVASMETVVSTSLARRRFSMTLLAGFAALALVLAAVGIYGVLSYTVSRRVREIGLRMALGARRKDILRQVAGRGLVLAAAGVAAGLAVAASAAGLLRSLVFGVGPLDPWSFAAAALSLLAVAAAASALPAWRASRLDPHLALREE